MLVPKTRLTFVCTNSFEDTFTTQEHPIRNPKGEFPSFKQVAIPRYDHGDTFSFTLRTQQALKFLGHFHLAQPADGSRIGALLSDFIRGTPESLQTQLPPEVSEITR
ncbi:hypothetical protein N9106_01330 [Akkermansiaceae bacterium]|nr:hypothetical protein [Akkermansiaceae bacterium]MDB4579310.1 hypothetical protein [Akkermansiaceae bacterium]